MILFNIKDWALFTDDDRFAAINHEKILTKISLSQIPTSQKRRTPETVKSAFTALSHLKYQDTPIVYASQHGELDKSLAIIRSFSGDISPTKFSLSVHNAAAGIISIIKKNHHSYNVIDSFSGIIEHAILDAVSLLSKKEHVLVLCYEIPFPKEIRKYDIEKKQYALALLIEKGQSYSLEFSQVKSSKSNIPDLNALTHLDKIIDFLLPTNNLNEIQIQYHDLSWRWKQH